MESRDPPCYQMPLTYHFSKLSNKYASSLATIIILLFTCAVPVTSLLTAQSKDAEINARFPLTLDGFTQPMNTQQKGIFYIASAHKIVIFISPKFYG